MKALLVKTSSLGDVVHALPAVTDAVQNGVSIDWVVEEGFADVPRQHPGVDRVIPMAFRRWRRAPWRYQDEIAQFLAVLRAQSYDVVLDSQGLLKSALVSLCARGARHGFAPTTAREPWASFSYGGGRHVVPWGQHAIARQRQLFAHQLFKTLLCG